MGALATWWSRCSASSDFRVTPAGIAKQHEEENVGIWRQLCDPLQHLIKGKVVVVGELDPVSERLGRLLEGLSPGTFE